MAWGGREREVNKQADISVNKTSELSQTREEVGRESTRARFGRGESCVG